MHLSISPSFQAAGSHTLCDTEYSVSSQTDVEAIHGQQQCICAAINTFCVVFVASYLDECQLDDLSCPSLPEHNSHSCRVRHHDIDVDLDSNKTSGFGACAKVKRCLGFRF